MSARGLRPSVLFDQAAAPLGQDASGRYYLVRLADDPTAARLLKRFDHPGWRTPAGRLMLAQQLWRLARLGRPELPGLSLEEPTTAAPGEVPPYACVLDAPGPRTLAERLPLSADDAGRFLVKLLDATWACHQARVTGLRFDAHAVSVDELGGWRWLAPDLVPPGGPYEAACREDLQALARFGRGIVDRLDADEPLAQVLALLALPEASAMATLQQALAKLGQDAPMPTLPASAPLMGCESEVETLGAWLRKCAQERHMHVVWLGSDPGSLQWDLCEALASHVRPSGMRVAIARCETEHSPEVFVADVARQLLLLSGDDAEALKLVTELEASPPAELPAGMQRLRIFRVFRRLLQVAARRAPLCLAWLGFERADGLVQELVAQLRRDAQGLPVLLLLGQEGNQGVAVPDAGDELLLLRPLFRAEVERLARLHCPGLGLGVAAIDAAWAYSGGQAAQVYRLCLHWLRAGGLKADAAGAWVPRDEGPRLVPPESVREFLRAIATLGPAGTLVTMQAVMDMPAANFFGLLEAALDGGWLRQEPGWLGFWQPEEARGLSQGMPPADALRWHRRLAAVAELPEATRAFHAVRGGQDAVAGQQTLHAGLSLLGRGALEAAARQFRFGLDVVTADDACRVDLLEGLATAMLELREPAQALALLVAELAKATGINEGDVARLAVLQGRARGMLGDYAGARAAYERALPRLAPDAVARRARVIIELAELAYDRGERDRGQALAAEALELASAARSDVLRAEAHVSAGRGALMGPRVAWPEGLAALADAVSLAMPVGQLDAAVRAHRLATDAQRALELFGDARASNQHLRTLLDALGRVEEALPAALQAAWIALQMGRFQPALDELARYDFDALETQRPDRWAQACAIRAVASLHLGYLHDPLRLLDRALRAARNLGDEGLELAVMRQMVGALLFLGKDARAEEVCQNALGLAAALGERGTEQWLRADLAEVAWRGGDLDRAQRLFQLVAEEARDLGLAASQARGVLGQARVACEAGEKSAMPLAAEARDLAEKAGQSQLWVEAILVQGDIALSRDSRGAAATAYRVALERADLLESPHMRSLASFGLGQSVGEPAEASDLLARAVQHMNVYLEQLSANGRKDFLAPAERRRIVDVRDAIVGAPPRDPGRSSLPGTRSALIDLIKQGQGAGWGAWQDSLALIDEIFGLVSSRLPLDTLLARLNATFVRISQAGRGMVFLANEDDELRLRDTQVTMESAQVLDAVPHLPAVLAHVRQTGETLWITNALEDPTYRETPEVHDMGLRGVLCIPLKVRSADGETERVIGCLYGDRLAPWLGVSDKEVGLLELMARYIGVTLEVGVLQDESSRKTYRLEMLNDLSRALAGTLDLERLLGLALMQIMRVSAGQQGYLFFGEDLKCRASLDQDGRVLTEIQVSRSVIERVARDRKALAILDVGADEELQQKASLMIRNIRSVMCVPLVLDDRLVGLIYVSSAVANKTFTRNDLDLMTAIASQIALALQNAQAYEIIKEMNESLEAKVRARTAELEQAYRELQEAQAQLLETEKLATIGTLAGGVAHEINNPLGAVLTNAQLLMVDLEDPDHLDSLRMIEEGARRCKEIVAALLKYSRPPQASHRPVDMQQVVVETLGLFERQLQQEGIKLETAIDVEPTVMGDATELRQVVAHLVLNAIDAVHEANRPGHIAVTLTRELDGVRLAIVDDGAGMGPDVLKRIFDPFYTTKKVGSGTGLGLSVCQRVIDKHGGKIQVQSTPGAGSTFTIVLPAA